MIGARTGIYAQQAVQAASYQGLFNTYSTGWAAGYSVRLLDAANVDTAKFTVRRDSDNDEVDLMVQSLSNPWIDLNARIVGSATTLSDFVTTNSAFVTKWWDESGNTNHATQTTASNQPMLVNAGSLVTENGKAALDFDGSDDFMVISDFLGSSTLLNAFHVVTPDVVNTLQILLAQYAFSGNQRSFSHGIDSDGSPYSFISSDGSSVTRIDGNSSLSTVQQLYTWLYDGSQSAANQIDFWIDSVSQSTTLSSGSGASSLYNTGTDILIGAQNTAASPSAHFNGKIQESTLRTVSSDRANVESNINTAFTIY